MANGLTAALLAAAALTLPSQAFAQSYTIVAVCHTENKVAEVDPATGRTLNTFVVPGEWFGETHEGAITADGKTMYVSTPYQKKVLILNLTTFTQKGAIESAYFSRPSEVRTFVRVGKRETTSADPHGVALNGDESKLYVSVEFADPPGVVVVDLKSGASRKIDTGSAGNYLWVQPKTGKLYFPTRDNKVVVVDTKTDTVLRSIPVQGTPNGVDFSPNGDVWVNGDRDGSITVIDSKTDTVVKVLQPRSKGPGRVAASPDGRFVAATHGPDVSIVNVATREIVADLKFSPTDTGHGFPVFSPDSNSLHVMSELSDDMVTFDLRTMKEIGRRVPIGGASFGGGIRRLSGR
jgi:YVTN family beta-propeller protein